MNKTKQYVLGVVFGLSLVVLFGLSVGIIDTTPCVGPYELTDDRLKECMSSN